jgi:hypothetical protein
MTRWIRHVAAGLMAGMLVMHGAAEAQAQSPATLPAQDRAIQVEFRDLYTVGGLDAEPWAQFGSVSQVAFDGRGRLYVLDRTQQRVVVIDEQGAHIRTLGRHGRGPGEFTTPGSMAVFTDGSVTVNDRLRRSLSAFDSAGNLRYDVRVPLDEGEPHEIHALPDGSLATAATVYRIDGAPHLRTSAGMVPTSRGRVLVISADGRSVQRVAETHIPPARPVVDGTPVEVAFLPALSLSASRDGRIVFTDSTTYALHVIPRTGGRRVIQRALAPRAVTEQDRRSERSRRLAELDAPNPRVTGAALGGSVDRRALLERERRKVERMRFATEIPVISDIGVDGGGRIWVRRTGRRVGEPGPIDIITPTHEYVGTITSAVPFPVAFGPGQRVAFIETDELGVQRIRVARIVSSALRD